LQARSLLAASWSHISAGNRSRLPRSPASRRARPFSRQAGTPPTWLWRGATSPAERRARRMPRRPGLDAACSPSGAFAEAECCRIPVALPPLVSHPVRGVWASSSTGISTAASRHGRRRLTPLTCVRRGRWSHQAPELMARAAPESLALRPRRRWRTKSPKMDMLRNSATPILSQPRS
jgi:hypothetical protein